MLKKYDAFLKEEITIKGNPGIPGEDGPNKRTEKQYLRSAEERGSKIIGGPNRIDDIRLLRELGPQIGQLCQQSLNLMVSDICTMENYFRNRVSTQQREQLRQRFERIETLAERVIRSEYSGILHDVELDIKIVLPHQVKEFMDECEPDNDPQPDFREVKDDDTKKEIHKRKIANTITQGEAKNTKHILHSDEVKEGINEIFGQRNGSAIFNIWDQITKIADKMDWVVPIEDKAMMMEEHPEGYAGAVAVQWEPEEETEEEDGAKEVQDEEPPAKEVQDEYDGPSSEPEEDTAPMENFTPIVRARGIDFPMLLHEIVKGIHELISAAGIPEDKKVAKTVMMNTDSFLDEAEDFRYGPIIAADIRDFVNKNPNWDKYPNIRQHVYGHLYRMPAGEFLELMKGILSESATARRQVDQIIDQVIKDLDEFEMGEQGIYTKPDDGNLYGGEEEGDVLDEPEPEKPAAKKAVESPVEKEEDYSKMSQNSLQYILNNALDQDDFETIKKISPFLKTK